MKQLKSFGMFACDFVIGDDWHVAVIVVLGLALTAVLSAAGVNAWWLLPLCVFAALAWAVHRATASAVADARAAAAGSGPASDK